MLLAAAAVVILLAAGTLLAYLTVTEYRPLPVTRLTLVPPPVWPDTVPPSIPSAGRELTCLTWNIGYAGLGRSENFFYDGGTMTRPPKEKLLKNLEGILHTLVTHDTVDFIFIQEVDTDSKRSYRTDEVAAISEALPSFLPAFALNYDVRVVPVPVFEPMGKVTSGIMTLCRWKPLSADRYQYQVNFAWPKRLGMLKRCFLAERFPLDNGKELIMVNLHNSAFDVTGRLRSGEMKQLQEFLEAEYDRGNYVVAGGDWNSNPTGFSAERVTTGDKVHDSPPPVSPDFIPGWHFASDPDLPSNRDVDMAYVRGTTGTTIIDFFVTSPNIEVRKVKTLDAGFAFSDHNPVLLTFLLK